MVEKFFPDRQINRIEDITLDDLREYNIKALIIDIDNTICKWKEEPNEDVKAWFKLMKRQGIKLCLVSNNKRYRAEQISRLLEINAIHSALKPSRRGFFSALTLMGTSIKETAVVGDQLFTDIYGGNRLNIFTIYVKPICDEDYLFVKMKRPFEKFILKKFRARTFEQKEKRLVWKQQCGYKYAHKTKI